MGNLIFLKLGIVGIFLVVLSTFNTELISIALMGHIGFLLFLESIVGILMQPIVLYVNVRKYPILGYCVRGIWLTLASFVALLVPLVGVSFFKWLIPILDDFKEYF